MFISVPARKVNSIPPSEATRVIQSVTCKKPRFPKTAPKTISIIATDNPSRSEIKLAMKMMITSTNKLNWGLINRLPMIIPPKYFPQESLAYKNSSYGELHHPIIVRLTVYIKLMFLEKIDIF